MKQKQNPAAIVIVEDSDNWKWHVYFQIEITIANNCTEYWIYLGVKAVCILVSARHRVCVTVGRLLAVFNEMKWNEKCNDLKCVQKPTQSRLSLTHHANKSSRWAE